jgi:hypothetical protein
MTRCDLCTVITTSYRLFPDVRVYDGGTLRALVACEKCDPKLTEAEQKQRKRAEIAEQEVVRLTGEVAALKVRAEAAEAAYQSLIGQIAPAFGNCRIDNCRAVSGKVNHDWCCVCAAVRSSSRPAAP